MGKGNLEYEWARKELCEEEVGRRSNGLEKV